MLANECAICLCKNVGDEMSFFRGGTSLRTEKQILLGAINAIKYSNNVNEGWEILPIDFQRDRILMNIY